MGRRILGATLGFGICTALWIGLSCYTPPQPACGFACSPSDNAFACPPDYTCNQLGGYCQLNGTTAACIDAAVAPDADLTPPVVVSTIPTSGQQLVMRNISLEVMFDQDMLGIDVTSFQVTNGPAQLTGSVIYDASTRTATFTSEQTFPAGALITASLSSAISNTLHVPLTAYAWSFTTIDDVAPTLTLSTPIDGAINVSTSSTIILVFSEAVTNVNSRLGRGRPRREARSPVRSPTSIRGRSCSRRTRRCRRHP